MKFRKDGKLAEAIEFKNEDISIIEAFEFITGIDTSTSLIGQQSIINSAKKENGIFLENGIKAEFGDYIVKEKDGIYVYKSDIFKKIFIEERI